MTQTVKSDRIRRLMSLDGDRETSEERAARLAALTKRSYNKVVVTPAQQDAEQTNKREHTEEFMPTICVLGATGVGKGSTLNSCFRSDKYSVGHLFSSDTTEPAAHVLPWQGSGTPMRGVDLCGFSDSEGRDSGFIDAMVAYLKDQVKHVHCFLLLLNSQEARIGQHLKDMLVTLKTVFGIGFMKNVVIGFTRWDYSEQAAMARRGATVEALTTHINTLLRDVLGHNHDCKCIFIDNTVVTFTEEELQDLYEDELPNIKKEFDKAFEVVRLAASSNEPFFCSNIEATLAERDVGRGMSDRERAARAEGKEAVQTLTLGWVYADIEEPEGLQIRLQEAAAERRNALNQFLASKTKPDLEHVRVSVLAEFDAKIPDAIKRACLNNRIASESFNRALVKSLVTQYRTFITSQLKAKTGTNKEQFKQIHDHDREIMLLYMQRCQGGSLSWGLFLSMQNQLCQDQFEARDRIFGENFVGSGLPSIRRPLTKPESLIDFLGGENAPRWLVKLGTGKSRL